MTKSDTSKSTSWTLPVLSLLLAAALGLFYFQQSQPVSTISPSTAPVASPESMHTAIDSIRLLDVNFWEARVEIVYSLEQLHGSGYAAAYMTEAGEHSGVGVLTRPGSAKGVALLARHLHRPGSYKITKVMARMYDPFRHDRNYYEAEHSLNIDWPGAESIEVDATPDASVFSRIKRVTVFRSIPDYIRFNTRLAEHGVPPDIIDLQMAPCTGCEGSIIFGDGVPVAAVQTVIRTLVEHDFQIHKIEFDPSERLDGIIQIGQTPTNSAREFWSFHESLIAEDVTASRFFELIGFPQLPPAERAIALHERAKALIDYPKNSKDTKRAGVLLDRALELDSSYIPTYIEMARLLTRKDSSFSPRAPSASATQSIAILKNALKMDPDYANVYVLLGYYQTAMRQYDEAKKSFQRAQDLGTDNLWLYANWSILYEMTGQDEQSITSLERVTQHMLDESDNDRALRWSMDALAPRYVEAGRYEDAQRIYERLMADFPGRAKTLRSYAYFLATYTDQRKRLGEVEAEARRRGCSCETELAALTSVVDAALAAGENSTQAVQLLVKAQSAGLSMPQTAAQLSLGSSGRLLLRRLIPDIITMGDLESQGSVLLLLFEPGAEEAREFFLSIGASPNVIDPELGASPLMIAVYAQEIGLVRELMEHGGDPHKETDTGVSAMKLARDANNKDIMAVLNAGRA